MNPIFEKVQAKQTQSIQIKSYQLEHFDIPYHFHPENEMVYFLNGYGRVFINNSVATFRPGDLFFFAANVPHLFVEDKSDRQNSIEIIVIQFEDYVFNSCFNMPEFKGIETLFKDAQSGLKVCDLLESPMHDLINTLVDTSGLDCFLQLSHIFNSLKKNYSYDLINRSENNLPHTSIPERMHRVNHYILKNYTNDISLDIAATISGMNKASFCRFFRKHTRKSFGAYVNDMRLDYACKLLLEGSLNISSICYEVGFNSVPYFIKVFKRSHEMTPKKFRQRHSINL